MQYDDYSVVMICDCHSMEHNIILVKEDDEDYPMFSIGVSKNPYLPFWKRIINGLRYIFVIGDSQHDYTEVLLNDKNVEKLKSFIADYEKSKK